MNDTSKYVSYWMICMGMINGLFDNILYNVKL